eukprot:2502734-Prymnesium_polylepis.2
MIQADIVTLDRVIGAFFDTTSAGLTLLLLLPVMASLSGELTIVIALTVPVFLAKQMRMGGFTERAAEVLRDSEAEYLKISELAGSLVLSAVPEVISGCVLCVTTV